MVSKRTITIIIPVYNEENTIQVLTSKIKEVIGVEEKYAFEIIFIDDGSIDKTWLEIERVASESEKIKAIKFSRNFGHQSALEAGLQHSQGDAVITMDGDLQHPPEIIPKLLRIWEEGHEIVITKRIEGKGVLSFYKKYTSQLFCFLFNLISTTQIIPGSDFRLMDRLIVKELEKFSERNKFYRGLISWVGFNTITIPYQVDNRLHGHSSFTLKKLFNLAFIGITTFSTLPLKLILSFGMVIAVLSLLSIVFVFWYKNYVDNAMFSNLALLVLFIIFSNGLLITILGINSIYQVTMLRELLGRPNYIVHRSINLKRI